MGTAPLISVVMPLHNGEAFFDQALASLPDDPEGKLEIIALDSSEDARCAGIAARHDKRLTVCYEHRPEVTSWTAKTNLAVARSRGGFVSMLHQDDLWLPSRLDALMHAINAHPEADLYLTAATVVDGKGKSRGTWRCPLAERTLWSGSDVVERLLVQNFIALPSALIPRRTWDAVGGLDENLWYTPDWDMFIKAALRGAVHYTPAPTVGFRIHGNSQTITGSRSPDAFVGQMREVLARHGGTISGGDAGRILRVAAASTRVNGLLAEAIHGRKTAIGDALWELVRLGPWNWRRYFQHSRLHERVLPRLMARLKPEW